MIELGKGRKNLKLIKKQINFSSCTKIKSSCNHLVVELVVDMMVLVLDQPIDRFLCWLVVDNLQIRFFRLSLVVVLQSPPQDIFYLCEFSISLIVLEIE